METQTTITLNLRAGDAVLLHELAHQWIGNAVTPRTWKGMWLNEGFATYIQALYEAGHSGESFANTVARWRAADGELRSEHGPPGDFKPDHFGARNVYISAALMLHQIRERLGDKRFFAMIRAWAQEHRGQTVDRASFISWLNAHTGTDLSALVNRWLDAKSTPGA